MIVVHDMFAIVILRKLLHVLLPLLSPPKVRMVPPTRIVCIKVRIVSTPQKLTYRINLSTCLFYPATIGHILVQWSIVLQSAHIKDISFGKLMAALACAKASISFESAMSFALTSSSTPN